MKQLDATLAVLFVTAKLLYMFRTLSDPWHALVAASTVFSTPDDGRRKRQKHVE